MAMSALMSKVHDLAEQYDKALRADAFPYDQFVQIAHGDGTRYEFRAAFMLVLRDSRYTYAFEGLDKQGWILVFTEHHGFHVFHEDDLKSFGVYRRVKREQRFPVDEVLKELQRDNSSE
jgi:hypothetical protein